MSPSVSDARLCAAVIVAASQEGATLALVSDRRLSVAALAALLLQDSRRSLVQAARGEEEVSEALETYHPHLLIGEGAWQAWPAELNAGRWGGRTMILMDPEEDRSSFLPAVRSGAQGFLSRTASREALETAIQSIRETGYYLDPLLAGKILWASEQARAEPEPAGARELSQRELEVLARIASGRSSKQIAREYQITPKTVCNHVSNIYAKLQVRHRGELVLYAAAHGLTVA